MENRIKIVVLDYYMSAPLPGLDICYSEFRGAAISQIPVLRCFGSNGFGKKICIHIHGAFPYLYIPYDGSEDSAKLSNQLAANIDKTLNVAMNQTMSSTQHVYKIALVSGIPMYGYHFKKHQFFKIYLYNPMLVTKLCGLLLNQSIMGKAWQPHEAHLNFTLQFMIDYNLHGMSNMIVEGLKYRVDSKIETNCDNFLPYYIEKITTCEIEADVNAQSILNRQEVISGKLAVNPGIAALWEDEKLRRRHKNETSQLGQFIELKNMDIAPTKSHNIFKEALLKRLAICSNDEINETISPQDISVYPAESPDDREIQYASILEFHTPSSYETALNDTSFNLSHDDSIVSQNNLDMTLEESDKEFLNMLQEMTRENRKMREEDSILFQTVKDDEYPENNEPIDSLDMTLSLEELSKDIDSLNDVTVGPPQTLDVGNSDEDSDILNTTIIPQLDGPSFDVFDELNDDVYPVTQPATSDDVDQIKCGDNPKAKSLPYLDQHFCPQSQLNNIKNKSIVIKDLQVTLKRLSKNQIKSLKRKKSKRKNLVKVKLKKKVKVKLTKQDQELKSFQFRIKKENRKEKLRRVTSYLKKKDRAIVDLMAQSITPEFHIISGTKWFLARPRKQRTVISEMLVQTKSYTDPNLHLIIETPNRPTYLYFYGGRVSPEVVEVPYDILRSERQFICNSLSNSRELKKIEKSAKITQNKELIVRLENLKWRTDDNRQVFAAEERTIRPTNVLNPASRGVQRALQEKLHLANGALQEHLSFLKVSSVNLLDLNPKKEALDLSGYLVGSENSDFSDKAQSETLSSGVNHNGVTKTEHICDIFEPESNILDETIVLTDNKVMHSNKNRELSQHNGDSIKVDTVYAKKRCNNGLINDDDYEIYSHHNVKRSKDCYVSLERLNTKLGIQKIEYFKKLNKFNSRLKKVSIKAEVVKDIENNNLKPQMKREYISNIEKFRNIEPHSKILLEDFNEFQEKCVSNYSGRNNIISSRDKLIYLNCDGTFDSDGSETEEYLSECISRKSHRRTSPASQKANQENFQNPGHSTQGILDSLKKPQKCQALDPDVSDASNSSNDDLNTSFFQKYCFNSTAKKYDEQTGFVAQEGCSRFPPPEQSCSTENEIVTQIAHCNKIFVKPLLKAPTKEQVERSLNSYNIESVRHEGPFYSDIEDCTSAVEVGQSVLHIPSKTTAHLNEFESFIDVSTKFRRNFVENVANLRWNRKNVEQISLNYCSDQCVILTPVQKAPNAKQVQQWVKEKLKLKEKPTKPIFKKSKIYLQNENGDEDFPTSLTLSLPSSAECNETISITQNMSHSFGVTGVTQSSFDMEKSVENFQSARSVIEYQYLTTLIMELHVQTRGNLKPDPEYDSIYGIFYTFLNDFPEQGSRHLKGRGVFVVNSGNNGGFLNGIGVSCQIFNTDDEPSLIREFLKFLIELDPDILAGYEIQMLSWGYLVERARFLGISVLPMLGRSEINKFSKFQKEHMAEYDLETAVTGRIVLDVWRLMRHEVALQSYTFESIVSSILHRRIPKYSFKELSNWWGHNTHLYRHRVVRYYLYQVESILELLQKLDFINRTSELAKLFGIMFYEVLSRGSQFRVESMMLRLAKPLNYIPVSPSQMQRAHMRAPEFIPLVMEPASKMYNDPVIVLDFQSLYPSIIIAYNYCFTTCMGRIECLGKNIPFEFGASMLKISRRAAEKLAKRDLINYSPCGVAFVKSKVREGILPRMLKEILDTRLMVKNAMKENKTNNILQKVLHNRQLGLKLIANVTYGYTAANFSGRMCCVEVGDSVVSKGRETLQRAIAMVDGTKEWGARVVYGDTDSLFVCVAGKSREVAFEIGKKIAEAVSNDNPDPIKLKLEKVYQPCILQTKKRYVGYMYESPEQEKPVYDAKGIETVRRDGCPAVSKILEKCLHLLFETKDVSLIKKYVTRQFSKIQSGKASIRDLTFAKEYRGAAGYKPGACVPSLELARKWKSTDRRNEPRSGERVPYVIVNGPPGLPLIRLVRSPYEVLNDSSLRLNSIYYITKVIIPPINRCLSLIGADVNIWFNQMPRKNTVYLQANSPVLGAKTTLSQYFANKVCASCTQATKNDLCEKCVSNPAKTALVLLEKISLWETKFNDTKLICESCTGYLSDVTCISLDCPVLYRKTQNLRELQQASYLNNILNSKEIFLRKV